MVSLHLEENLVEAMFCDNLFTFTERLLAGMTSRVADANLSAYNTNQLLHATPPWLPPSSSTRDYSALDVLCDDQDQPQKGDSEPASVYIHALCCFWQSRLVTIIHSPLGPQQYGPLNDTTALPSPAYEYVLFLCYAYVFVQFPPRKPCVLPFHLPTHHYLLHCYQFWFASTARHDMADAELAGHGVGEPPAADSHPVSGTDFEAEDASDNGLPIVTPRPLQAIPSAVLGDSFSSSPSPRLVDQVLADLLREVEEQNVRNTFSPFMPPASNVDIPCDTPPHHYSCGLYSTQSDPRNGHPVDGRDYQGKWKVPPWEMPAGSIKGRKRRGGKATKKGQSRAARQVQPEPRWASSSSYPSSSSSSSSSPLQPPVAPVVANPYLVDSPALDAGAPGAPGAPVAPAPLPSWTSVPPPLYPELEAADLAYDAMPGWEQLAPTCVDVPDYNGNFSCNYISQDGTDSGFAWFL
ncbi:hypothetical protein FISHEDRAFT_72952 [Fistulina hepatica ATCC 64428]|uniref:Uncharacterized protein n=1 Tax=Fistulina hepatica ATCC 64428 TaxID=1128425 RepID=A0A0D7AFH0_9AGAR|nr:hypothetical protein FISHEDRAFT_72952 [Fistulina hepatica ATCC 64428]